MVQSGNVTNTAIVQATTSDPDTINNEDSETTEIPAGFPRPLGVTFLLSCRRTRNVQVRTAVTDRRWPTVRAILRRSSPPTITIGTGDANGRHTSSIASERVKVLVGNPQTGADEADVQFSISLTDIRTKPGLGDYTGQLQMAHTLRITNRLNGDSFIAPATIRDYSFKFAVPCSATTDTTEGSTCAIATTADALVPGAVREGKRALRELNQVTVFDGGSDGVASTDDNVAFAKQGIFVP